ncbi:hypothetical protein KVH27_35400 [Streptomyces olivaceus]|uniref:hypothetical protein n=1 Tax=Streptomyces olivaceus TaxID=47716 RepID=UPI001CCDE2F3|nr:hypothetical protein [Streptomyces olivaceus]MBZ6253639.1 hypothetical protein [Streptomyces olivaceus]
MSRLSRREGTRVNQRIYTVPIESDTANDEEISYRALGLLVHMLNKPANWQMRSEQLSKGKKREGRDAVRKMLHELAAAGYYRLERRQFRDGKHAMGTAISFYAVEQWKKDYVTFGGELTISVVEQEDGSFLVRYPDGSTGGDGFDYSQTESPADDVPEDAVGDEPEKPADDEPESPALPAKKAAPRRRTPPAARKAAVAKEPSAPAKKTAAPKKTDAEKAAAAAEKEAQEKDLDEAANKVATWWWSHAEQHLGKYAGQRGGFVAVRKMVRRALAVGYSQQECAKALQHARRHFPAAQQWQDALGVVTNHIAPQQRTGRIPYSDAATWSTPSDDPTVTTAAADDADDATFGVIERP